MNKEDIIKARNTMAKFLQQDREYQELKQKYKEVGEYGDDFEEALLRLHTLEEIERFDEIKLCQRLNSCFTPTRSEENVYICLGAYYNGMGPNRIESKKIYENTPLGKKADILYYINISNYSHRLMVPICEVEDFEKENIIIHLNTDNVVENNFAEQEQEYDKVRMFYLLELLKSNLDEKPTKIRDNILIKVRKNIQK